jgi:hypothetical protein
VTIDRIPAVESERKIPDDDRDQQHEVYEKPFRGLEDVTPDDNDEGITVVTDWIIEQMRERVRVHERSVVAPGSTARKTATRSATTTGSVPDRRRRPYHLLSVLADQSKQSKNPAYRF